MAVLIQSVSNNARVFVEPVESNLFRLSTGDLVCFYSTYNVSNYYIYYTVSTDDGATWGTPQALYTSVRTSVSAINIPGTDNFYVITQSTSTGYTHARICTYNSSTHLFTASSAVNISSYLLSRLTCGGFFHDSKYWSFYGAYRSSYLTSASYDGAWAEIVSPEISSSGLQYCDSVDAVSIGETSILLVSSERLTGKVYFNVATKSEDVYAFGSWSQINNEATEYVVTTAIGNGSVSLHKVSDTEIWLAVRTTHGYVFYMYNGSAWSSSISISPNEDDISGRFAVVNGIHVWAYAKFNTNGTRGVYGRILNSATWGNEFPILDSDTIPIWKITLEVTENTSNTLRYCYLSGESAPYNIYFDTFAFPEGAKIEVDEDILLAETIENDVSNLYLNVNESISLNDTNDLNVSNENININEDIKLSDLSQIEPSNLINIDEDISLLDANILSANAIKISEELFIEDTLETLVDKIKVIDTDVRILKDDINYASLLVSLINGTSINTDIRILKQNISSIGLDVRVLKYDYDEVSQHPITYDNIDVKINNISLADNNDVDLSSITIIHNIDSKKSTASFILHRKMDNLNVDVNGTASIITTQNTVQIFINNIQEFEGKISQLNVNTESETVNVSAIGERPIDKRNSITIPFSTLNSNLNLYDCLISDINIDNPYIDPDDENPEYYKGIEIDRGTLTSQKVSRWTALYNALPDINAGTFQQKQNWSYFWTVGWKSLLKNMFGTASFRTLTNKYIGSSLSALSSDVIELTNANYQYQRIYEDDVLEREPYRIGEAPYMQISDTNGVLITKEKWEDRSDGLYVVKDASYDYDAYTVRIAQIEYEKLKNINGDILPITSCNVTLSIDAYYFYDIKLLKRLNFSNTTSRDIYNNQNGFPVSVKSITINTSNMTVVLNTSNQWSVVELDEFDTDKPDSDQCIIDERATLIYSKWDVNSQSRVY